MFIKTLEIEGYKAIKTTLEVNFQKGLNVIVGENGSGKTAVIDALRKLLQEDEYGRVPISDSDFYKPFESGAKASGEFSFHAVFSGLSTDEQVMFLPWAEDTGTISLTMQVVNKLNSKDKYKPVRWGGVSQKSMFEWELFDAIDCIYLPPLRDAELKLSEGKYSRLARLLKNLDKRRQNADEPNVLVGEVNELNKKITSTGEISAANELIKKRLKEALGSVFAQDTSIQFGEVEFNKIAESVRLLFFPISKDGTPISCFRSLAENSLGHNNLLYLATVLAELAEQKESDGLKILLIEEPEAHLHPQLQIKLLKYLESKAKDDGVQVIVTTHSPVIASSVSLNAIIQLSSLQAVSLATSGVGTGEGCETSLDFLNRWLDATKSNLLFAKGVLLVEGIAEALLLPEFAKLILYNPKYEKLPKSLEDAGVSVVNMNGIYFKHFMQLFCDVGKKGGPFKTIPIRCSGITDMDPDAKSTPTPEKPGKGANPALKLEAKINASPNCRLYPGQLKTFEYDLAFEGNNIKVMAGLLAKNWPTDGEKKEKLEGIAKVDWKTGKSQDEKAKAAFMILENINDADMGKGQFAQILAKALAEKSVSLEIPLYIEKGIVWACAGDYVAG